MGTIYKEVEEELPCAGYVQADIHTGVHLRTGTIYRLEIFIEDDETGEVYFNIHQYWIKDDERGVILNDKGDRMLFDNSNEAVMYVAKNKSSLINVLVQKMKISGFNSLTDKEKETLKEYNKKNKQSKNNNLKNN